MSRYNYGNHVFNLKYHRLGHYHDYEIEIGRQRKWKEKAIKTTIGMFFNETFTGMTILDWGNEDLEQPWRYVFQGKEVTSTQLVLKLKDWLEDDNAQKFINDLNLTRRLTLKETMSYWQRDNNMWDKG